ncbi:MAG: 50S ribosomal protein L9 [Thermodesulfobacteriota bacterium]
MKIILKEDVTTLGSKGDMVNVANGYARNYLIPKGLALLATPQNLKVLQEMIRVQNRKAEKLKEEAAELARELEALTCTFSHQAGDDGKLFGSVTSLNIEEFLKEKGYSVEKKNILLEEPIKALGTFTVQVKVHQEIKANLNIQVVKKG